MNDDRWAFPPQPPAWPAPTTTPPKRGSRTLALIALFVATGVVAAGVGVGGVLLVRHFQGSQPGATSPTATPVTSSSAAEARALYEQAKTAAGAATGFHYVGVATGALTQTIVGDAGQSDGRQAITFSSYDGTEQFTLFLVNSTVYFQGNLPALEDQLGVTAATAPAVVGKWISLISGNGPYTNLEEGITTSSQATQMPLTAQSTSKATAAGGVAATRIVGIVPPANGLPAGTGYLEIAPATDLPIIYSSTVSEGTTVFNFSTTFSNWGTAPSVSAPSGTTAWSSLTTAVPPGGYGNGGVPSTATPGAI
jgi:hypothetical protein